MKEDLEARICEELKKEFELGEELREMRERHGREMWDWPEDRDARYELLKRVKEREAEVAAWEEYHGRIAQELHRRSLAG